MRTTGKIRLGAALVVAILLTALPLDAQIPSPRRPTVKPPTTTTATPTRQPTAPETQPTARETQPSSSQPELDPTVADVELVNMMRPAAKVVRFDEEQNVVIAEEINTGRRFQIRLGSALRAGTMRARKTYRPGQTIYRDMRGKFAAVPGFPIRAEERDNIGASSRRMKTSITLSDNGRIDATTRTWTSECMRGFTGAAEVGITDLSGNVLYRTMSPEYGVNGECMSGESDRTEIWTATVPEEALNKAAAVVIAHHHTPKNRFPGAVEWVTDNWDCIIIVYGKLTEDGEDAEFGPVEEDSPEAEEAEELIKACEDIFG